METLLDRAFCAHQDMPDDHGLRLRFHERLLDAELFLLLREEATREALEPEVFALETGPVALVFDLDERLAAFLESPAEYAALSGRRIVALLAGQGLGLGLNLGVAPSSTLLPAEAVSWLAAMAAVAPAESDARVREFTAPRDIPQNLLESLAIKLGAMAAGIRSAHLVAARHHEGGEGALLALTGVPEAAQADVAAAVAEAVRFSGGATAALDVAFPSSESAVAQVVARVGWRLELPRGVEPPVRARSGLGTDPERPPILR